MIVLRCLDCGALVAHLEANTHALRHRHCLVPARTGPNPGPIHPIRYIRPERPLTLF